MNWQMCLSLFLRSAVLLLAGEALRRAGRRAPAVSHRILLLTFGLLAALPLLSVLLPPIPLPAWASATREGLVTIETGTFLAKTGVASHASRLNWPLLVWLTGVLAVLAPTLLGSLMVWRMSRRAVRLQDASWTDIVAELAGQMQLRRIPDVLCAPSYITPLVWGFRRPRILLPTDCIEWTPLRRRVVLLHELAHVKRGDVASQMFAQWTTALWWFQPLAWTARRGLRRESEHACDAQAVAFGIRPSEYAAELLAIARDLGCSKLWTVAGVAMARPGSLESRLLAILTPQPVRPAGAFAATAVLLAVAFTASAVTLTPAARNRNPGGVQMKRSLLSGLLVSAGLSAAASISGSVYDPSGAAIPDAMVSLYNPDAATNQEMTSASDGKFHFANLPGGQYILRIRKPGFAALFREFTVQPDTKVDRGLTLQLGSIQEAVQVQAQGTPSAQPVSGEPKRIQIGGNVQASKLITKVVPPYPVSAKMAGLQGTVVLRAVILTSGIPGELTVVSSPGDELSQSSLEAVRQWRYSPTLLNGNPVEVVTMIHVNYTLQN